MPWWATATLSLGGGAALVGAILYVAAAGAELQSDIERAAIDEDEMDDLLEVFKQLTKGTGPDRTQVVPD